MEGWVAYADVKEFPGLNDSFKNVVFIVLRAQREAFFECGVVGDNRGYVLKRMRINVATNTLPTINLAGQYWVDSICSRADIEQLDTALF